MAKYTTEMVFPYPQQICFEFLSTPENLLEMMPAEVKGEWVDAPEAIIQGAELEFRFVVYGIPQQVRYLVMKHEPFSLIVEKQIKGPFKHWQQTHRFTAAPNDETLIQFEVEFECPGGMLGMLLTPKRVCQQLDEAVDYREQRALELLSREA